MRRGLFVLGTLTLIATWGGPLPELARRAFWAHMSMHMLVVALAAPLIAIGMAGQRSDPVHRVPGLFSPIPASILELIVVWGWHAPGLHHAARHQAWGLVVEQGMFLLCGLLVWLSCFGGPQPRDRRRSAAGVVGLLMTSMHMTLLGALLALAPRTLYEHTTGIGGLSALQDQHLGGAIMLLVGGIAYLLGGLWLTVDLVRRVTPSTEA